MAVSEIKELRILPPLAIGRFGSSNDPMDNYTVEVKADLSELRELKAAETLLVDRATGEITGSVMPDNPPKFRDDAGKIRPVAPFFEVWARFDNDDFLQPLTAIHLADLQLAPSDVRWKVQAANHKAFRRTGDPRDKISAVIAEFSDHAVKQMRGTATNLKNGKSIPFGSIQYLKPTDLFPEIRLRFTPPAGKVYGTTNGDPNITDDVYNSAQGRWDGHRDGTPGTPPFTNPGGIYARDEATGRSLGYLDDACDGIVECRIGNLSAIARFSSGPPAFAPDSFPVRTVADELEQMLLGTNVIESVSPEVVSDVLRRALDTVWHLNSDAMNVSGMAAHDRGTGRAGEPIFQPVSRAVYPLVRLLHQNMLKLLEGFKSPAGTPEREQAIFALRRIVGMVRAPGNTADLSNSGRRRMPAMMRNSDGFHLTLTRRQINKLRRVLQEFDPSTGQTNLPEQNMLNFIRFNVTASVFHVGVPIGGGQNLSQLFSDPPALLNYLKTATAQGDIVPEVTGQPLVVPGNPDASAFVALISNPNHPMNGPFSTLDPTTNKTGITIVREWISSLT